MLTKTKGIHILRYGTNAEQKFIEKMKNSFDLLAINGNMLAHTSSSISNFILTHFIKTKDKGYFIDPITYAFQLNLDMIKSESKKTNTLSVKKSIQKLLELYGEPVKSKILDKDCVVTRSDFSTTSIKESYCKNVVNFQLNTVRENILKKGLEPYINESGLNLDSLYPEFIIPPYFYLTTTNFSDWIDLNLEFIDISKRLFNNKNYAQIVISKDFLTEEKWRDSLISAYSQVNVDGYLLWIDSFDAHTASESQLYGFCKIVQALNSNGKDVFNLYGDFFSIILTGVHDDLDFSLTGVGHGLEYGESRAVAPVGGGIPTSKYYFYPLHSRLDYKTSTELLRALGIFSSPPLEGYNKYLSQICRCPVCKVELLDDIRKFSIFENNLYYNVYINGVNQRRTYASQETKQVCLYHYLYNKNKEFKYAQKTSLNLMLNELDNTFTKYYSLGKLSVESLSYLKTWKSVLKLPYEKK